MSDGFRLRLQVGAVERTRIVTGCEKCPAFRAPNAEQAYCGFDFASPPEVFLGRAPIPDNCPLLTLRVDVLDDSREDEAT